jgi:death-on-curing protein
VSLWWPVFDDVQSWVVNNGFVARDWGLFDAALNRPLATIGGSDVYPTLWEKAAAFLDSVEGSHPFVDGNKRVGFLMVALVLMGNGIDISHVSDDDWFDLIMAAAAGHLDVAESARRIQALVQPGGHPRD